MNFKEKHKWCIRRATRADARAICELLFMLKTMYASTPAKTFQEFLPIHLRVVQRAISLSDHPIFIATKKDGSLIGFISLTVRTVMRIPSPLGSIEELFVRFEHRRKGVGTGLWKAAAAHLAKAGVNRVEVITSLAHPGQRPFARSISMEWYASVHVLNV